MTSGDVIASVVGWVILLSAALWYVRRIKHPTLTLVVVACYMLGLEGQQMPGRVGAVLAFAVALPAWRLAVGTIRRPRRVSP